MWPLADDSFLLTESQAYQNQQLLLSLTFLEAGTMEFKYNCSFRFVCIIDNSVGLPQEKDLSWLYSEVPQKTDTPLLSALSYGSVSDLSGSADLKSVPLKGKQFWVVFALHKARFSASCPVHKRIGETGNTRDLQCAK